MNLVRTQAAWLLKFFMPGEGRGRARGLGVGCWLLLVGATGMITDESMAAAMQAPSQPGVDAPQLAALGSYGVGVRTLTLVQKDQVVVLDFDPQTGKAPLQDRKLVVDVWYPASVPATAKRVVYQAELPGNPPDAPAHFSIPGIAMRGAKAAVGAFPLIVVSHGYSNATVAMSWLTENLASKGYVVAAIRHEDPPITDPKGFPGPLLRRPLDISFVTDRLSRQLADEHLVDPDRVALIGYSMGGYGVVTAAGASLDSKGPANALIPGSLLAPYVRGGARQSDTRVAHLKAVVALAPAGGGQLAAWGGEGLAELTAPMLLIAGTDDRTVDYRSGARMIFDTATKATRYLLTYQGGGHAIGLNSVPDAMRQKLWDQDWFEDPVWRKDRIIGINTHFITAFLDLYVKGDASRAAYLQVPVQAAAAGQWPASAGLAYDAFSPGEGAVTVWKGFQRNHAAGLELLEARAQETPTASP